MEHPSGEGNLCRRTVATRELAQDVVDPPRLAVRRLVVCAQPPAKLLHGVPREPLGSLRRIERLLESNVVREPAQLRGERAGDQMVPRTRISRRHGPRSALLPPLLLSVSPPQVSRADPRTASPSM
ncbi:MAG: hypothetical protein M3502_08160 [Actinomycetota bacterium]|nr:hypothetical protein [Actinomycetota bacterium]